MIKWRYLVEEVERVKCLSTEREVERVYSLRLDSPQNVKDRTEWLFFGDEMGQLQPGQEFILELRPVEPEKKGE